MTSKSMGRRAIEITVVGVVVLVVGLIVWNFERIHFLIVARRPTQQELAESSVRIDGYYHRWKTIGESPVPVGTWIVYFGKSRVIHFKREYSLKHAARSLRTTIWLPNGRLFEQIEQPDFPPYYVRIDRAPWKWGEKDQSVGTKQLRSCSLTWMRLDGLDLRDADLADTVLHGSTFHSTDLQNATLEGANLCGADFSRAHNLTAEQVLTAKKWDIDKPTTWNRRTSMTRFSPEIEQELTRLGLRIKGG